MLPTFQTILDQEKPLAWLRRALAADRLPHGLIFAGPPGVGKGTTARALATLYLCHKPHDAAPCGQCESCRLMSADPPTHPDFASIYRQLIRLDKNKKDAVAKDLSIHVVRDHLIAAAGLKPALGHGKVFVVEEAHLMNPNAQNSLLKTLEEPFGRTLILLLTDQPDQLLPTIKSRTQLLRFNALDEALVTKELTKRGIDPATAQQAAALSEGSLGSGLQWIEDGVIPAALQLHKLLDDLLARRPLNTDLADWFKSAAEAHAKQQQDRDPNASLDQAKREALSLYLRLAAQRFRRLLRESSDPAQLDLACTALESIAQADDYLDGNVNIPLIFQQLAQRLTHLPAA
jgi:DNA polymerase-3 subunit delta'